MAALRAPDECFANLPDFPFAPHYIEVNGLRMHYVDEGPRDAAETVLLLHGEPSWCFLYRKMIPILVAAGHRVIAPDLIGFGRSDKLPRREDYSYRFHVTQMTRLVEQLGLQRITLFGQDWGGLIGLRVAVALEPRFARIVVGNTGLPTGDHPLPEAFFRWRAYSQTTPVFHAGGIVKGACATDLSPEVIAAYDAPFPDERYLAGARAFPMLVPTTPDDPEAPANRQAWQALQQWKKPFLTAFSDSDPVTKGGEQVFQKLIPGAHGQPHVTILGAGHFLQEDKGEELAHVIAAWIAQTPHP
ncbi:MAG: haloalkane dehalogenase [Chloracidobacterium sp.]|uniref:Haloalkane dehalogenase n=1 Tax=Chloracidobacterium validum TaxID=2821543 RepID=A0ABX8BAI7_9BACT|nr:haloalkane dehalogenase [Chloracidobacterium validum]QUW03953.1 haloalkane dehalogenase [Chloracidobacterium validum]